MPLPARWRSLLARPQGRALLAAAVTALALAVARFLQARAAQRRLRDRQAPHPETQLAPARLDPVARQPRAPVAASATEFFICTPRLDAADDGAGHAAADAAAKRAERGPSALLDALLLQGGGLWVRLGCCKRRRDAATSFPRERTAIPAPSAAKAPVAPSLSRRPDFNGRWLCTGINDGFGPLLEELGAPWGMRILAQAVKYGLGKVQCNVRQDGDRFEIENVQRLTTRLRFAVDGGVQETTSLEAKPMLVDPHWGGTDGRCLVTECRRLDGRFLMHRRQYFEGDQMVVEIETAKGVVAKRVHTRQDV